MGTNDSAVLLTGAGFTHNFGAPLASDMWSLIFSQPAVQGSPRVRQALRDELRYETAYHAVIRGPYSEQEKEVLQSALLVAFQHIDATIRNYRFAPGNAYRINIYRVQQLIAQFGMNRDSPGYFFTLNQDLFVERHYYNGPPIRVPGLVHRDGWFSSTYDSQPTRGDFSQLPTHDELAVTTQNRLGPGFYYIKLHGSQNWQSAVTGRKLVIGQDKAAQIEQEPLLAWYLDLFREELWRPARHLLAIGYGFGDDHINEVIGTAAEKHGLQLFVLDPADIGTWRMNLLRRPWGNEILRSLSGHYPYTFERMFPEDQSATEEYRNVLRGVFGVKFEGDE